MRFTLSKSYERERGASRVLDLGQTRPAMRRCARGNLGSKIRENGCPIESRSGVLLNLLTNERYGNPCCSKTP